MVDVLVFYLVLRGLDTVEDDMTAFKDAQVTTKGRLTMVASFLATQHDFLTWNAEWCLVAQVVLRDEGGG